ncbi:MAG: flagellar protein FliS [Ignavibacteria bacterium]|nr:flagellar protein FliS [Ignavibacteria bacterium]
MLEKAAVPLQPARKVVSQYRQNVHVNLSPVEIIIKMYDAAIFSLKRKDVFTADKAITELILALNFDKSNPKNVADVASGFLKIYEYCKSCIRKKKLEEAEKILQDLRDAWSQALKQQKEERINAFQTT